MDPVRTWIESSPYSAALGVQVAALDRERVRLVLPYADANSNPGQALHGGCAASLAVIGSQAVARATLGVDAAPWHICGLQVSYLAAAIAETVTAEAVLLRRGKQKGLLRHIAAQQLPPEVVHAHKRGFGPNLDTWFRGAAGELMSRLRPLTIGQGGPLAGPAVEALLDAHAAGRGGTSTQVWSLLCLELWWRLFVAADRDLAGLTEANR